MLGAIGAKTVNELQTLSFSVSATDADGNALTYAAAPLPAGATLSGQTFVYTPSYDAVSGVSAQVVNVTFTVTDSNGASDSEVVPITVNNVNRAPTLANPGSQSASEGSLFTYQLNASDPDGDGLVFTAPSGLPPGALLNPISGLLTWNPGGNQAGTYPIALRVTDSFGALANRTLTLVVADVSGVPAVPARHSLGDFDGTNGADVSVFRGITGEWFSRSIGSDSYTGAQFGLPGDIPVPGDYNGDRITDRAIFRPSINTWVIAFSRLDQTSTVPFGLVGDIPVPADYDGDGRTDIAVFRPVIGMFLISRSSDGQTSAITLGAPGDIPVSCDYDGDGKADAAVFKPANGAWTVRNSSGAADSSITLGLATDIPVPGDFNADAHCEAAVWRPADGSWYIGSNAPIQFGLGGDVPVPSDYDGDGRTDLMVYRPGIGGWFRRLGDGSAEFSQLGLYTDVSTLREGYHYATRKSPGSAAAAVGLSGDGVLLYRRKGSVLTTVRSTGSTVATSILPVGATVVRGDYDGDKSIDTAVFNAGSWTIFRGAGGVISVGWGVAGDKPVAADFDGDAKTDVAVFRPNNGGGFAAWYVIKSSDGFAAVYNWGLSTDEPIPADYNGDGWADPAIFRPQTGSWYVIDGRSGGFIQGVQWGLAGDQPRALDFDGDGRADKAVFRSSLGLWFVAYSSGSGNTIRWGQAGDIAVPGSYLTPGQNDFAVWRPAAKSLYILATNGTTKIVKTTVPATDQVIALAPPVTVK